MTGKTSSTSAESNTEQHEFSAEVGRLLDLVVHALYSEREIFLRELVANAADATDRRRFEALTDSALALPESPAIHITIDKAARTLTLSDDGIGMTKEELAANLGTIARSGTRAFGQKLVNAKPEERPSLIGQFGVGFYAAFMVADSVDVTSRHAGSTEAWQWHSEGKGHFTLSPAKREKTGTDITLHIKSDADEFLEIPRLEAIIRKWADNIAWPITIHEGETSTEANQGTAMWRKPKNEVTQEQLTEFYRHTFHMFDEPWATLHWHAEGTFEFTALLFIPSMRPMFEPVDTLRESKVRLHLRRMFITDEGGILPPWLRFVQGIVDTEDLPLNVSREMLQTTPVLARIKKAVTNRVMTELKTRAKNDSESYLKFWENFGQQMKEGMWDDSEHKMEIAALARFHSTHPDASDKNWIALDDYISRMKDGQEAIYYLTGDNINTIIHSPHLEGFKKAGIEVLLLADPVDSFWPDRLSSYNDKPLRNITQSADDLKKFGVNEAEPEQNEALEKLVTALKESLKEKISDIRVSSRLVDSPVVLAPSTVGPDLQLQRLLRRSGQDMPDVPPILELNPHHPLIKGLATQAESGNALENAAFILLDLARIQDGDMPLDPPAFAQRVLSALTSSSISDQPTEKSKKNSKDKAKKDVE